MGVVGREWRGEGEVWEGGSSCLSSLTFPEEINRSKMQNYDAAET